MRNSVRCFRLSAATITFFTALQWASAVPTTYRLWEDGFPNGGTVTGTMVIDETVVHPGYPGYLFYFDVLSFDAHWSGDSISQPFDFHNLAQDIIWNVEEHRFLVFGTDPYDSVFLLVGSFNDNRWWEHPDMYVYYQASSTGLQVTPVPDGGPTLLYLGLGLIGLTPILLRQNRDKAGKPTGV